MEESKHHSHLQEEQEGNSGEPQAGQPHLDPWEGCGTANPISHLKIYEAEKKIIRNHHQGLIKRNSYLTNLADQQVQQCALAAKKVFSVFLDYSLH